MASRLRFVLKLVAFVATGMLCVGLAACGWLRYAPRHVPAGQPPLETLTAGSLAAVKGAFNAGAGRIRVLAMLSPT